MKIFIGGVKLKHVNKFTERWPQQEFEFATEDEGPLEWMRKARKCQHHVVYQHRMNHKHAGMLAAYGITPKFTDSTPIMMLLVHDLVTQGKTNYFYNTKELTP